MFRQVVMHRWPSAATDEDRTGFRQAMDRLRDIPELTALRYGDDVGRFEGNHDFVAVLDFPDFDAARRYVETPAHRSFVADHASRLSTERVIVQHEWGAGVAVGLHHAKLPVTDVGRSTTWYGQAFGFRLEAEFREEGELRGVALSLPDTDFSLALRGDPERARALAGFDAVCLAVGTRRDLDELVQRLDGLGIAHTAPVAGLGGDGVDVIDPDGMFVRVHTLV
jgi:catechol 2,3-dioxygenase-like lactoylglutathione lyase family enzyme